MKGQSVNKSIQNERLSLKVNLSPSKFKPVKTAFPNVDLTLKRHQIDTGAAAAVVLCKQKAISGGLGLNKQTI